jgi:hypothetical protein
MTIITHTIVGLGLSKFFPGKPMALPILFSLIPDVDHLLKLKTWRFKEGGFREARTVLHELLGCTLFAIVGLALLMVLPWLGKLWLLCVSFHLFLDFISGYSVPFKHIKEYQPIDFGKNLRLRAAQEIAVSGIFLWIFLAL